MYTLVLFEYDNGYFITDDKDFDTLVDAVNFGSVVGKCYVVIKDFDYISAANLVARSSCESWSPLK